MFQNSLIISYKIIGVNALICRGSNEIYYILKSKIHLMRSILTFILVFLLSLQLIYSQETKGQIEAISKQIKKGEASVELYLKRGKLYNESEKYTEANTDFKKAIEEYNNGKKKGNKEFVVQAYYYLSDNLLSRDNDTKDALKYSIDGLDVDSKNKGLLTVKAQVLFQLGENEKAFEIFDQLISDYADDIEILEKYAGSVENHKPSKAKELYEKILTLDDSNDAALYFLGMHYAKQSDRMYKKGSDKALVKEKLQIGLNYLEKYRLQNPEDKQTTQTLVTFYRFLGQNDKAEELSKELAK